MADFEDSEFDGGMQDGLQPEQPAGDAPEDNSDAAVARKALVTQITRNIREDRVYHRKAFERMRDDMQIAKYGRSQKWEATKYTANIIGKHIRQRTASLYAKDPKATARVRPTLDYKLWDENPQTLMMSMQAVAAYQAQVAVQQQQQQAMAQQAAAQGLPVPPMEQPQAPQQVQLAQQVVQDAQQGMQKHKQLKKLGTTLGLLFSHSLTEQNPLEFKVAAKSAVRRATTTSVAYIKLGYQRQFGRRTEDVNKLADSRERLDRMQTLMQEASGEDFDSLSAEAAELELMVQALEQDPGEVLLREGLTFDFPRATNVIPDKATQSLVGFLGAGHVTVQYFYTAERVKDIFGVDLDGKFTPYRRPGDGAALGDAASYSGFSVADDEMDGTEAAAVNGGDEKKKGGLVCVWEYYDKPTGMVYYLADGHEDFLAEPAAPDVTVDDFWPIRALTFNDTEDEDELYPPSDVYLARSMQEEINLSREGERQHKKARVPRWIYGKGSVDEADVDLIRNSEPFEAVGVNIGGDSDMSKVFQAFPIQGVDPNLYTTQGYLGDMQLVVGAQAAQMGATGGATATESAIAANSTSSFDNSGVDDLDAWLTWIARSAGQIFLREMSPETVTRIAGEGAVWPGMNGLEEMTPDDIADDVYLEVEAGSSGRPNQAVEIKNWKEMLPFLLQMGQINPVWLAKESLRRLDDRLDLTDAIVENLPSIMAQNRSAQVGTANPQTDPNDQGDKGGDKAPTPGGPTGTSAPMGDNHE